MQYWQKLRISMYRNQGCQSVEERHRIFLLVGKEEWVYREYSLGSDSEVQNLPLPVVYLC